MIFLSTKVQPSNKTSDETTKAPSTLASKSTKLTDATKSKVSIFNPQPIMQPDNSTNSLNSTPAVNSDITVNCTTPTNADDLFDNEQTAIEATAITNTIEPPKQQRIGKQQRKSDFAEFKATFLVPAQTGETPCPEHRATYGTRLERVSRIPRRPWYHGQQLRQRHPRRASRKQYADEYKYSAKSER